MPSPTTGTPTHTPNLRPNSHPPINSALRGDRRPGGLTHSSPGRFDCESTDCEIRGEVAPDGYASPLQPVIWIALIELAALCAAWLASIWL